MTYTKRKQIMQNKRKEGWTYEQIGRLFGITDERVRQVLFSIKPNILAQRAKSSVKYAKQVGKIKKNPCEICGDVKAQAHHYAGYDKKNYLTIQWLCLYHHQKAHKTPKI